MNPCSIREKPVTIAPPPATIHRPPAHPPIARKTMTTPTSRRTFLKASAASAVAASDAHPRRLRRRRRDPPRRPGRLRRPRHRRRQASAAGRPEREARRACATPSWTGSRSSLCNLKNDHATSPPRSTSPPDRCFDGFDGYKKLLESASTWCCSARRRASGRCTCGPRSRPASTSSARSRWPWTSPASQSVIETREARQGEEPQPLLRVTATATTRPSARR